MRNSDTIPVLILTGPVGAGKTTVGMAVSEQLQEADTAHAFVNLDWLSWCYPAPPHDRFHAALCLRNLAAVCANYRAAGAERLVLAGVVETRAERAEYQAAIPGAELVVVRLHATLPTLLGRLAARESGASLAWHQHRAGELTAIMVRNRVEDMLVDTEGKSIAEIAGEVLARIGWAHTS
jgi:adenylylsulfate kinase